MTCRPRFVRIQVRHIVFYHAHRVSVKRNITCAIEAATQRNRGRGNQEGLMRETKCIRTCLKNHLLRWKKCQSGDLKLCWAVNPFHTKISYQRLNGMNVDTADKPVITRVSTFSLSLLRNLIWYEKYEITQACQMPVFQPGSSSLSSVSFLLTRKYTMPTPSPLPMISTIKSETVE